MLCVVYDICLPSSVILHHPLRGLNLRALFYLHIHSEIFSLCQGLERNLRDVVMNPGLGVFCFLTGAVNMHRRKSSARPLRGLFVGLPSFTIWTIEGNQILSQHSVFRFPELWLTLSRLPISRASRLDDHCIIP